MSEQLPEPRQQISRRHLLLGGAAAGVGALAAVGADAVLFPDPSPIPDPVTTIPVFGAQSQPCHGVTQPGITVQPTAHVRYLAFDLLAETGREAIERMLRILTSSIESLTAGSPALADTEPELALSPANLTVTVGFGKRLVERVAGGKSPDWLTPLPPFSRDQLDPTWCDGDLLIIVATDDLVTEAHTVRILTKDLRSFATLRWQQSGFRRARGSESGQPTMRNLMGQVDGTVNPDPSAADFAGLVWLDREAGWLQHGSAFVLRRIRIEMDSWDQVDRPGREQTIGRTLATGAPLTGVREHDTPDFEAKDSLGFAVIPEFAHITRARSQDPSERVYRRSMNYDDNGEPGLLFGCYQRDPRTQFVPIQQRLDDLDLLNEWVTHTGSTVFAMPPGWQPGGMVGETLFRA